MKGALPLFEEELLPAGLIHLPSFLAPGERDRLVTDVERLEFGEVRMRGVAARRRVVHFGLDYSFDSRSLTGERGMPAFLFPLRERVAVQARRNPEEFAEALVTEYPPGATIGWHRDAPPFGIVAGVSLGSECRMRFRRDEGNGRWSRAELWLLPGSLYLLDGPARSEWEHSIPPVAALRYSITFRTLQRPTTRTPTGSTPEA